MAASSTTATTTEEARGCEPEEAVSEEEVLLDDEEIHYGPTRVSTGHPYGHSKAVDTAQWRSTGQCGPLENY